MTYLERIRVQSAFYAICYYAIYALKTVQKILSQSHIGETAEEA